MHFIYVNSAKLLNAIHLKRKFYWIFVLQIVAQLFLTIKVQIFVSCGLLFFFIESEEYFLPSLRIIWPSKQNKIKPAQNNCAKFRNSLEYLKMEQRRHTSCRVTCKILNRVYLLTTFLVKFGLPINKLACVLQTNLLKVRFLIGYRPLNRILNVSLVTYIEMHSVAHQSLI